MAEPNILKVAVKDLIPYANNSRLHSDEQVNQIASSIKEFGFLNPIIIDSDNGIIAGHGRVMACNKLGIKEVPCIDASHLTEAQKKAYVIADNKIALNSDWDVDLLRVELEGLKELDFDLGLTGFSTDELDDLLSVDLLEDESLLDDGEYTTKIDAPIYDLTGEKPDISNLLDKSKSLELQSKIEKTDIDDNIKSFLIDAAKRHFVFRYDLIAEFYAHADIEVKNLMEDLALVIVDYDSAIESGYIKMNKALLSLRDGRSDE